MVNEGRGWEGAGGESGTAGRVLAFARSLSRLSAAIVVGPPKEEPRCRILNSIPRVNGSALLEGGLTQVEARTPFGPTECEPPGLLHLPSFNAPSVRKFASVPITWAEDLTATRPPFGSNWESTYRFFAIARQIVWAYVLSGAKFSSVSLNTERTRKPKPAGVGTRCSGIESPVERAMGPNRFRIRTSSFRERDPTVDVMGSPWAPQP